jgi:hypothetical protein
MPVMATCAYPKKPTKKKNNIDKNRISFSLNETTTYHYFW